MAIRGKSEKIRLIVGDALKEVKKLDGKFDIVFLDPFSPKKAPELWSKEFLKDIVSKMKTKGVLTTYSCAGEIRRNLAELGLKVKDGPCVGRRAPSTIAVKI